MKKYRIKPHNEYSYHIEVSDGWFSDWEYLDWAPSIEEAKEIITKRIDDEKWYKSYKLRQKDFQNSNPPIYVDT